MSTIRQRRREDEPASLVRAGGIIQRTRALTTPAYVATIGALALVTFGLGFVALYLTPRTGTSAIWWPAAAVAVILYLLYRGPKWQGLIVIAAVTSASIMPRRRPVINSAWGALLVVVEVLVFALVLGPQGRTAMLGRTRGLLRFIAASVAASAAAATVGAIAFALLSTTDPLATFASIFPSHLSAFVLIVPLALVPLASGPPSRLIEIIVQAAVTTAVAVLVFAPFQSESIGTLLFPLLGWAAVRFAPIIVTVELVLLGTISSLLTVMGGGPFAPEDVSSPSALLVQIYVLSIAVTIQFITVVRSERMESRAENEWRAALLRGGFVGSQVGSVFIRIDSLGRPSVIEINDVASALISAAWFDRVVEAWHASGAADLSTEVQLPSGQTIQVYGRRVPSNGDTVVGLQLVDISDFIAAQEALAHVIERERAVADELRALAQQKDDFVSAVSHELRTPITSILGFAEDLAESVAESQREAAQIILRNAARLTEMVEELLELGRMTSPNPLVDRHSIDMSVMATEAIHDQATTARDKQIVVEARLSSKPALVMANENSAGRIATNLLANAIKFTPEGGSVVVTTLCADETVQLIVDDSGPGISADDQPRVFERFYRSADPAKRQTPGTGLGLSIVKSLVELLEGTIDIDRSPLGGARMIVTLPLAGDDAGAP